MKHLLFSLMVLLSVTAWGQSDAERMAQPIVEEGRRLYRLEMASWHGTDLFLSQYKDQENIGGYFSYTEDDISKCIFFSREAQPKVIGTISFDSNYNVMTAPTDLTIRAFTSREAELYSLRKLAMELLVTDTFFRSYERTSFNVIPLIDTGGKRVYVLTASQVEGYVIFGNDYLLTFDQENKLVDKKRIHQNILRIENAPKDDGGPVFGTLHTHHPETGDFITATDICTLMLYEKFTTWQAHTVVSKNYMSVWNCKTDKLSVVPMPESKKSNRGRERSGKRKR